VICVITPTSFLAVGQAYRQFDQVSQVSDDELSTAADGTTL
jgi:predicted phosphoribosyltransferase